MDKKLLVSVILIAFLAGSLLTGSIAFGEKGLTKLEKECSKIHKSPQKIKPHCQLLALINAIPAGRPTQVYEVSGVSVIPEGSIEGSVIQLRCLEGDTFHEGGPNVRMSTTVDVNPRLLLLIQYQNVFNTDPNVREFNTGVIGANVKPRMDGGFLTFDVPVTATGLCFSPSP